MASKTTEPLRGEAAWKAAREQIAKKNAETCAKGRRERDAREAAAATRRNEVERRDRATWGSQPSR
jgi:hypothetical protein